jgi:hypothetical protein
MMDYPGAASLRRCWPWQPRGHAGADLERVAYHEAGHVVLMEWLGLEDVRAEATATGGKAHMPPSFLKATRQDPFPDESGILAATAAAVCHAGVVAEQIRSGQPWRGPIHYPDQDDFKTAEAMLQPRFGRTSSAGHGYAQRVARHVLELHWERVQKIAAALIEHGHWSAKA